MATSRFILARSLVASTLLLSCLAQGNNDTTSTASCPDPLASFNSSGQISFQFASASDEDWYISLAFEDERSPVTDIQMHLLQGYISYPQSTTVTRGCFYQFNGVNTSASGTGANGCEGLLSDECMDLLRGISFPTVSLGGSEEDLKCERLVGIDKIRDACPEGTLSPGVLMSPLTEFSNQTCEESSPPGESVPEQYRTWSMGSVGSGSYNSDRNASSFAWYDLFVQRAVPIVLAASFSSDSTETQIVCVAPDHVAEGSREPEDDAPWESAGARKSWLAAGNMATVAAIAVVAIVC